MKFKNILFTCFFAAVSTMHGYSWRITNETDKDLYIYLGTKYSNPIGKSNKGQLLKKGQSTGASEIAPNKFTELVVAEDESLSKERQRNLLSDSGNINYSITKSSDTVSRYKLLDNNNPNTLEWRKREKAKNDFEELIRKINEGNAPADVIERMRDLIINKHVRPFDIRIYIPNIGYVTAIGAAINKKRQDILNFLLNDLKYFIFQKNSETFMSPADEFFRQAVPKEWQQNLIRAMYKRSKQDAVKFLYEAAKSGNEWLMQLIKDTEGIKGMNIQGDMGNTALHLAVEVFNVESGLVDNASIKLLLKYGADPNVLNVNKATPLYLAIKQKRDPGALGAEEEEPEWTSYPLGLAESAGK